MPQELFDRMHSILIKSLFSTNKDTISNISIGNAIEDFFAFVKPASDCIFITLLLEAEMVIHDVLVGLIDLTFNI